MANYWITPNARFRPFSYDEMIRPVEKMYTEHKGVEEGLAELQTKAGIWEGLANEQTDPVTYAQYKRYADELKMAADDLAMNGLNARSRQGLYNMKARYASEITPIEQAYQLRAADIKAQSEAAAKSGGRTVFSKSARTASLDDYRNGMPLDYTSVNLDSVYNTVASGTQAITKRYFNTKEGSAFKNEYFKLIQQQGLNPTEAFEALKHSGKYPELDKYYTDALQSFGISNFSEADKARIMNAADMGMNAGIYYDQKEQLQKNTALDFQRDLYKMDYQGRITRQNQAYAASLAASNGVGNNGMPGFTVPVHFTEGASDVIKDKMARQTMAAVADQAKAGNKGAVNQLNEWAKKYGNKEGKLDKNGRDKLVADLVKYGWSGDTSTEESKKLYFAIGNYIRDNVTKNENLINIWRAPSISPIIDKTTALQINKGKTWGPGAAPAGGAFANGRTSYELSKWNSTKYGNFDDIAKTAFTANAIGMRDDRSALNDYLEQQAIPALRMHTKGQVKMYDIQSMNSKGEIKYSSVPMSVKDLPHTSTGNIDYGRITRYSLHNGDWMYVWEDDKGNLVSKAVKRKDLGPEAVANWDYKNSGVNAALAAFATGKITADELQSYIAASGSQNMYRDYLETAKTKVKDYEIE